MLGTMEGASSDDINRSSHQHWQYWDERRPQWIIPDWQFDGYQQVQSGVFCAGSSSSTASSGQSGSLANLESSALMTSPRISHEPTGRSLSALFSFFSPRQLPHPTARWRRQQDPRTPPSERPVSERDNPRSPRQVRFFGVA